MTSPFAFELFVRGMSLRDEIADNEIEALKALPVRHASLPKGYEIISDHARADHSCIITKGLAARAVFTANGERQLTALHISGDFVDLHAFLLKVMDHAVVAMSACEVAYVSHRSLLEIFTRYPHLGRLFWLSTVVDAAIQRAWTTSLGRRTAAQAIGHLMCELYTRLKAIGAVQGNTFALPLTQQEFADLLGMSIVHVNRKIKELRLDGLVFIDDGQVRISDFDRLAGFSEFDPIYLNFVKEPR